MKKILVLYYSMYGHVESMADAVAEGAGSVDGTEVTVKRVPECWPVAMVRDSPLKPSYQWPDSKENMSLR